MVKMTVQKKHYKVSNTGCVICPKMIANWQLVKKKNETFQI
jgi:hypothetical protein